MTDADRRRRIEDLCDAALDQDADERSAFRGGRLQRRRSAAAGSREPAGARADGGTVSRNADHGRGGGDLRRRDRSSLVGRQIGAHKILSLLGAGGMGEVYRARDTKLGRDVAIKVVPDRFLSMPDRLARFELEARVLATLNHPHIAAIYGLEEADGVRGLVLELVEGPTLGEHVAFGTVAGSGSARSRAPDRGRARSRP